MTGSRARLGLLGVGAALALGVMIVLTLLVPAEEVTLFGGTGLKTPTFSGLSTVAQSWGGNTYGQLGSGSTTDSSSPSRVSGFAGAAAVAAGYSHSVALNMDGSVRTWGRNDRGQLGNGSATDALSPVLPLSGGASAIAAGHSHTVALKSDGTVWAWGSAGHVGDGSNTDRSLAVQVSGLSGVTAIAAGSDHSLALKGDGTVWAWGSNSAGQLGNSVTSALSPVQVSGLSGVTAIAAGGSHSLALKSDGTVWSWGSNTDGQLGDGSTTSTSSPVQVYDLSGVTAIAAGANHSLAVQSGSPVKVWAWGGNSHGQLGDGTTAGQTIRVRVGSAFRDVSKVAAGGFYSLALKSDGTVWAWGYNSAGQLGDGTRSNQTSPVQVSTISGASAIAAGHSHSLAVTR